MRLDPLERRALFSLNLQMDYSLDTAGYFDIQSHRDALEYAASLIATKLNDNLLAVTPSGSNTLTLNVLNPATGSITNIQNPTIATNTITIYAGARPLGGPLAKGGGVGSSFGGSADFITLVRSRGQSGADTSDPTKETDIAPLGGSIVFDPNINWNFSIESGPTSNAQNDFVSVAAHELIHVLGIGTTDSWFNLISNHKFLGAHAAAVYGSSPSTDIGSSDGHFADGTISPGEGETAMDPTLTVGTRKLPKSLDFAALDDIGWEVTGFTDSTSGPTDRAAPTLAFVSGPTRVGSTLSFTFSARDNTGFASDLSATDISLLRTSDNTPLVTPTLSLISSTSLARDYKATFTIPGGEFTSATAGDYEFHIASGALADPAGNPSAPLTAGPFTFTAPPPPTVDLAITAAAAPTIKTPIGSKDTAKIKITNASATLFNSTADIRLYLASASDPSTQVTVATVTAKKLKLAFNKAASISLSFLTPATPTDDTYTLLASIANPNDTTLSNNIATLATVPLQTAKADLAIAFIKPPTKPTSSTKPTTLTLRTTNLGNVDLTQSYTLQLFSLTGPDDTNPTLLATFTSPTLKLLRTKSKDTKLKALIPPGTLLRATLTTTPDTTATNNTTTLQIPAAI